MGNFWLKNLTDRPISSDPDGVVGDVFKEGIRGVDVCDARSVQQSKFS